MLRINPGVRGLTLTPEYSSLQIPAIQQQVFSDLPPRCQVSSGAADLLSTCACLLAFLDLFGRGARGVCLG